MQSVVGQPITATIVDPNGNVGAGGRTLGARVEVPVTRAIVAAWRPATLSGATWTVTVDGVLVVGEYQFVWRTNDAEPPFFEAFLPLTVTASVTASGTDFPEPNLAELTPSVEDISQLMRTRTVSEGGEEVDIPVFDENTHPTADEVEGLIEQARFGVLMALPETFDPVHNDQIRHLISLYTAQLVEGSYFREQVDDSGVDLWRTLYTNGVTALRERMDADLVAANLLKRMEPPFPHFAGYEPWRH